jgi:hypothetical protein
MARKVRLVTIHTGPVRIGGWCERCQLPSLIEFDLMTLSDTGVNVVARVKRCADEDDD